MKDDKLYLYHILESISKIEKYTKGSDKTKFLESDSLQDSVIRRLEIIGEAVKNLSPSLISKDESIPWSKIARMRDKLIHKYFGVDAELVWDILKTDLPLFKKNIEMIIKETNSKEKT